MNKKLTDKLLDKYPLLYPSPFKFYHGDGWYSLIEELSEKLKDYPIKAAQVKEKFGGLRYYIEYTAPISIVSMADIGILIGEAESKSFSICEITGEVGRLYKSKTNWLKTLSEKKAKELEYKPYIQDMK